jgi:hypothetical protein
VLGYPVTLQQRDAPGHGAGGEVLGQLAAHCGLGHHTLRGEKPFGFAADVGGVPRRAAGGQPGQHPVQGAVAVECADRGGAQLDRSVGVVVAEGGQFGPPPQGEVGAGAGGDLVRAAVGPCPGVPGPPQCRPGGFSGVRGRPVAFVAVQIAPDLRRPGTERTDVLGELQYFSSRIERVAVVGQRGCGIGDHRRPRRARCRSWRRGSRGRRRCAAPATARRRTPGRRSAGADAGADPQRGRCSAAPSPRP